MKTFVVDKTGDPGARRRVGDCEVKEFSGVWVKEDRSRGG